MSLIKENFVAYGDIHIARIRIADSNDIHIVDITNKKLLISGIVNSIYPNREKNNLDFWEEGFMYAMHLIKPNFSWATTISTQKALDEFLKVS